MARKLAFDSSKPRTPKDFGAKWQRLFYKPEELVSGNTAVGIEFPSAEERQKELQNLAIDASLMLYVYEELCEGKKALQLAADGLIHRQNASGEIISARQIDEELPSRSSLIDAKKRREIIFEKVCELSRKGCIKTHRDMTGDELMDRAARRSLSEEEMALEQANRITGAWIQIENPGSKSEESIRTKLFRKSISDQNMAARLRDVNRIMVMPSTPEVYEDYFRILGVLHPPKELENGETHDRLIQQGWEVKNYGYFDKMVYLALDKLATGEPSTGDVAPVAEIQVCAGELHVAEKLTDPMRAVARMTVNATQRYKPKSGGDKRKNEYLRNQQQFVDIYQRAKEKFDGVCKKNGLKYEFPAMPKNLGDDTQYALLSSQLTDMMLNINIAALNAANSRKWADKFLETYYFQQAALEDRRKGTPATTEKIFKTFPELGGELDEVHGLITSHYLNQINASTPHAVIKKQAERSYKDAKMALRPEIERLRGLAD